MLLQLNHKHTSLRLVRMISYRTPMIGYYIIRYSQSQSGASYLAAAGFILPVERLEYMQRRLL